MPDYTPNNDSITRITQHLSDRLLDENENYLFLQSFLEKKNLHQSLSLLPYIKAKHAGQLRSGKDQVPYYSHPLMVARHAVELGLWEDDLISAALLHDVCEDCGVTPEELPVSEEARQAVACLTKTKLHKPGIDACKSDWDDYYSLEQTRNTAYYANLRTNRIAAMVKLLDRCNNISGMSAAWKAPKLASYILETEEFVFPLLLSVSEQYPQYSGPCFLVKYHMSSVIEAIRHLIAAYE